MQTHFLTLDDFLLPPPLPAILSILIVLGHVYLGRRIAVRFKGASASILDKVGGYFLALAGVATLVHAVGLLGLGPLAFRRSLQAVGWTFAAAGILQLRCIPGVLALIRREFGRESRLLDRLGLWVGLAIAICLFSSCLGPPTDADSLDYHLGAPLDWLRHGGLYPREDWATPRLAGLGECLNLLGLGAGTDNLGALLQFSGLVVSWLCIVHFCSSRSSLALTTVLVCACPVVCALVNSQKPQMLPTSASLFAILILLERKRNLDLHTMSLGFSAAVFAIACKYSFILSAGLVLLSGLIIARASQSLSKAIMIIAIASLFLLAPVYLRNVFFYGDPLTPMGERWKAKPNPEVLLLYKLLREGGQTPGWSSLVKLPWSLAFTLNPGAVTAVLGIGAYAFILAPRDRGNARTLLVIAACSALATLFVGQWAPRFFLEPYLWASAAVAMGPDRRASRVFLSLTTVQGLGMVVLTGFGAVTLLPGAFSSDLRSRVLSKYANGADEAQWMGRMIPEDRKIMASQRSRALIPRDYIVTPFLDTFASEEELVKSIHLLIAKHRIEYLVCTQPPEKDSGYIYAQRYGRSLGPPQEIRLLTRNPFNRGPVFYSHVYSVGPIASEK